MTRHAGSRAALGDLVATGLEWLGVEPGTPIVLAVSGGPDSTALLHGAAAAASQRDWQLIVGHLDHRLRPDSAADAAFVTDEARALDLPVRTGQADVRQLATAQHRSLEDAGRLARYRFLEEVAAEAGATARIATAHTADDQAETVIMRLARGTGLRGLRGIPARRGRIVRPLLGVRRAELRSLLGQAGIAYRSDASNEDPDAASRNRVRAEVLPALERLNPAAVEALVRYARLAADDDAALDGIAAAELLRRRDAGGTLDWHDPPARAIGRRVVRLAVGDPAPDAGRIEALLDAAEGPRGGLTIELGGGRRAFVRGRRIAVGDSGISPASVLGQ